MRFYWQFAKEGLNIHDRLEPGAQPIITVRNGNIKHVNDIVDLLNFKHNFAKRLDSLDKLTQQAQDLGQY